MVCHTRIIYQIIRRIILNIMVGLEVFTMVVDRAVIVQYIMVVDSVCYGSSLAKLCIMCFKLYIY